MEYKLNKVDFEIQKVVKESTKEGRVHGNKETYKVDKDKKESNKRQYSDQLKKALVRKKKKKKRIVVDAVKVKSVKVDAFRDKESKNLTQGRFLDTKL